MGKVVPESIKVLMYYLESPLQLLELSWCESCPDPPLFPLLRQNTVVTRVHLVWQASWGEHNVVTFCNRSLSWAKTKKTKASIFPLPSPFSRNGENHWGRRDGRSYEASLRRLWEIQISCWNLLPNSRNNFLRPRLSSAFYGKIKHSVSNLLLRNFLTPGWN